MSHGIWFALWDSFSWVALLRGILRQPYGFFQERKMTLLHPLYCYNDVKHVLDAAEYQS